MYVILARAAERAVIFRRGPSKRVLLVAWDTSNDRFEEGQWLNGRIYERRCDLSPEGDLLLYFAAKYRPPLFSWSAISKPPFLTALALWPKGDGWGGGGHFLRRSTVALNHRETEMALGDGFNLPKWLTVVSFGQASGWGEDNPVWSHRLERDGWILTSGGTVAKEDFNAKVWVEFNPPITWEKPHPIWPERYTLRMLITGVKERNGAWYLIEHAVISSEGESLQLGRSEWAEWSRSGELLFAKGPCLYRLGLVRGTLAPLREARELADFPMPRFKRAKLPWKRSAGRKGKRESGAAQLSAAADRVPFAGPPAEPARDRFRCLFCAARHVEARGPLSRRTLARPGASAPRPSGFAQMA